jgi:protein-L-isoaspartate O-methyltransferase
MHATYSPEDNKLRLYPLSRLPKDEYDRVRAAGFIWAPKQELFVAPAWTPEREDLLIEMCGEIEDEDKSLVERAEERAERFDVYSEKRADDAERAKATVDAITDGIPFGQPILVGHHSEKHARQHAEQIQNGMRRAVNMWETSKYWQARAAGALSHAKYKELPGVRYRRIKGLEADIRRCKARYTPDSPASITMQKEYSYATGEYLNDGKEVPHVWCAPKGGRGGSWVPVHRLPAIEEGQRRWIAHYENRIAFEKAMLQEQGGMKAEGFDIKTGGQVLVGSEWVTVVRVNKSAGQVVSVTTNTRYARVKGIEQIKDYRVPTQEAAEKVKAATALAPLCNYPCTVPVVDWRKDSTARPLEHVAIAQAEWDKTHKDYKTTRPVEATETTARHRVRMMMKNGRLVPVFIADAKRKDPPAPEGKPAMAPTLADLPASKDLATMQRQADARLARQAETQRTLFDDMADALKAGVKVVSVPQLFPTPADLAARVVELADIQPGQTILEPSAGTASLIRAIKEADCGAKVYAVEINPTLAEAIRPQVVDLRCADFLTLNGELGTFDRIIMNPPFANAKDIEHIEHALTKLNPGGRLVAICANGPRQRERLQPIADEWIDLPAGSFQEAGTNVNAAIVVFVR